MLYIKQSLRIGNTETFEPQKRCSTGLIKDDSNQEQVLNLDRVVDGRINLGVYDTIKKDVGIITKDDSIIIIHAFLWSS